MEGWCVMVDRPMMPSADQLDRLPDLSVSQACSLKVNTGDFRVWLSRCGVEDGEPFPRTVYVEIQDDGRWLDLGHYDGDDPPFGLPGVTPAAFRGEIDAA